MRRFLSAAAALVLAFGVALLGASAANADDAYAIQTTTLTPGSTFTFSGSLGQADYITSLTYYLPGDSNQHTLAIDLDTVCPDATASNADGARTYECSFPLPADFVAGNTYILTANVVEEAENPSDPDQAVPDTFTVTTPSTFTSEGMPGAAYEGQSISISGLLPEGDTLAGLSIVTPAGSPDPGTILTTSGEGCFGPTDVSSSDRDWACDATLPTDMTVGALYDLVSHYIDTNDLAQTTTSSFTAEAIPSPTLVVSSDTTGTVATGTWTGTLAGQPYDGELGITRVPYVSPEASDDGSCEFAENPVTCTASPTQVGLHVAVLRQDFENPEASLFAPNIYFTIPSAPEVNGGSYDGETGTVTISGYGTSGDDVQVVDDTGSNTCTATADDEGAWSCTSSAQFVGLHDFYAYQIDTQSGDDVENVPDGETYQSGTYSASSAGNEVDSSVQLWDGLTLPSVAYTFIPGGVVTAASPTGSATKALSELYSWTADGSSLCGSGGSEGDGPAYTLCDSCPAGIGDGEGEEGNDFSDVATGTSQCTFENLAPGIWNPYSEQNTAFPSDYEGESGGWENDYFDIPTPPVLTAAVNNRNGKATISGTGIPTDEIHVVADGTSAEVCAAAVAANGTWSCTTGIMPLVSTTFRAYQEDTGAGQSPAVEQFDTEGIQYFPGALSAVTTDGAVVLITKGSTSTATTTTPPPWTFTLTGIDLTNIHPGDTFTVHAEGLPAGATITVVLHSTPVTLGTALVAADGTLNGTYTIPADVPVGAHEIILTMDGTGLTSTTSVQPVTIVPVAAGGTIVTTDPSKAADSSSTPTSHITHIDPANPTAPNILTRSIDTIQDVVTHPAKIGAAVAIGLVLLIFATLPARLLNATIAENYENLVKRVPRLGRRPRWFERLSAWLKRTPLAGGIALSAITAFLFGFADPNFGFTLASLRLIMGLAIALFIVEYLANAVTGRIIHRAWSLTVNLNIRPLGLVLTVIGVVASRLLHFSPGFLIGLVLGLVLTGRKAEEDAWKAVLVRSSVVLGFGLIAWIGYSALTTGDGGTATFWNELFVETLVAITTEGIVAILIELLPFRLLEGERIWHKSRILWAALYFVIIAAFVIAVVPWEGNWEALGSSLWIWIGAVAAFAVICLAIYFYFRFWNPFHETAEEQEENEPVDIGAGG